MVKINDFDGVLNSLNILIKKINMGDNNFDTQIIFIRNNWFDKNGIAFLENFKLAIQTDKATTLEVVNHYKKNLIKLSNYLS